MRKGTKDIDTGALGNLSTAVTHVASAAERF